MTEAVAQPQNSSSSTARHAADVYKAEVMDRIGMITEGIRASDARLWLDMPMLGRTVTLKALDLPVATFNKKVRANARLSPAESERIVGFARLVGQVETLVEEAGDPSGFDARTWLGRWLAEPLPALGYAKPIDFMNTMEGQSLVSRTLAQVASGASLEPDRLAHCGRHGILSGG